MSKSKRATIYLNPAVHKALRLKAAETDQSVSEIVDQALRIYLREDAEDLADIKARVAEPTVTYESFVEQLKEAGEL